MPEGPYAVDIRAQGRLAWGESVHRTPLGASAVSASPGVQFYRGPYDGLILDADDARAFCHAVTCRRGGEPRYFLLMPPLRET